LYSSNNPEKYVYITVSTKILSSTTVFNIDKTNVPLECFPKDHVTLKIGVMMLKGINYILNFCYFIYSENFTAFFPPKTLKSYQPQTF